MCYIMVFLILLDFIDTLVSTKALFKYSVMVKVKISVRLLQNKSCNWLNEKKKWWYLITEILLCQAH